MPTKLCRTCEIVKGVSEFHARRNGSLFHECKPCNNKRSREYKAANRDKVSAYNKEYKAEHCEEISVYNHDYNLAHREEIQKRQTITNRIRKANDPNYARTRKLRNKLYYFVKTQGKSCSNITELLGCDWKAFEIWFIFMFDEKMSFENHGSYWSIDHVNPCCNFDLTDTRNQYICFNWSNLRPVKILDNQKKTGKLITSEINHQKKMVDNFLNKLPKEERKEYEY